MSQVLQKEYAWKRIPWESWMENLRRDCQVERDPVNIQNEALFWIRRGSQGGSKMAMSVAFAANGSETETIKLILDWPADAVELTDLAACFHESLIQAGATVPERARRL